MGVPHPISAIKRRASAWLARHPSIQITWLGYLAVGLLAITVLLGAMLVLAILPVATYALQWADLGAAWGQLSASQHGSVQTLATVLAIVGALTLFCFSVFVGLTAHNATGLGAQAPILSPYRAGTAWWGAIWAQVRIVVGLAVPPALIWQGYTIPGLIAAVVAIEIAQRHLESGGTWMERPARGLPDLYDKLGMDETPTRSPIAAIWALCFRISNVLLVALAVAPWMVLATSAGLSLAGRTDIALWKSGGLGVEQMVIALVAGLMAGWAFASTAMLVPLTLGLVQRQRSRKTLGRVGRSRSWVARPGGGGYAPGQPRLDAYGDPEDRIVERVPGLSSDFAHRRFRGGAGEPWIEPGGRPRIQQSARPRLRGCHQPVEPRLREQTLTAEPGFRRLRRAAHPRLRRSASPRSRPNPGFGTPPTPQPNPGFGGQRIAGTPGPIGGRMPTIGGSGSGGILGNRPVPPPGFADYADASYDSGRIVSRTPNQASLYSPSTTSSEPAADEPSGEPPR